MTGLKMAISYLMSIYLGWGGLRGVGLVERGGMGRAGMSWEGAGMCCRGKEINDKKAEQLFCSSLENLKLSPGPGDTAPICLHSAHEFSRLLEFLLRHRALSPTTNGRDRS